MVTLKQHIILTFQEALKECFPTLENPGIELTPSTQAQFGHFQCNSAMKLAQKLGIPPRKMADTWAAALPVALFATIEVAGPGFINVRVQNGVLAHYLGKLGEDPYLGAKSEHPERILIDFSSPNIAKEMHVGHLRTTILGDVLARLLEFQGHTVLRINHLGDWGTSFGMLIAYMKDQHPDLTPESVPALSTLVTLYKAAKARFDEDAAFKRTSQAEVVNLQSGEPQARAIWERICEVSRQAYQQIYDILDIKLTDRGESFYQPFLAPMLEELTQKGVVVTSEGAQCIFLEGFYTRDNEPLPFMIQKADGGFNYAATDLAAMRYRATEDRANRIIIITDSGQDLHFKMLFAAAQKAGFVPTELQFDHVGLGLVLGPDGKKFKTRSGETEKLIDLLEGAVTRAEEILVAREYTGDAAGLAAVLGINAVKYADLSTHRGHDYVFSYEKMLQFEGNTAAYLMYAHVRMQSILQKVAATEDGDFTVEHPAEVALAVHLVQFADTLQHMAVDLYPHRLSDYLYVLANLFNTFFQNCRVEGDVCQTSRRILVQHAERILRTGMLLLGLKTVEKM